MPSTYDLRAHFDLDPSLAYLNSGTQSIAPRRVTDAVVRHLRAYERNPTQELIAAWGRLWETQRQLGAYLGARPEDLFLRPNVTLAMNALMLGIPLPAGGEILLGDTEYHAIHQIARFRAEQEGRRLRTFHFPTHAREGFVPTEAALVDLVVKALSSETRMVVLSHVMTSSGLRIPIGPISRELRKRKIPFVVDGAHATGAFELGLNDLPDLDFYAGNLHKWVMGPKGTGFAWVHPMHQAALVPRHAGWTTFEVGFPHDQFAPGHAFAQRHLDSSCVDFAPYLACGEIFEFWREVGPQRIRARLAELRACVRAEMKRALDWECLTPEAPELSGPLLCYALPDRLQARGAELMGEILAQHGVQLGFSRLQGNWITRFSPQIYNTEDEIRRGVRALAAL